MLINCYYRLQKSKEDASVAFTGEKSNVCQQKERGIEVWINYTITGLSIAFFVLAILASFFVERF